MVQIGFVRRRISEGWIRTILYDKRVDFNFLIVNFPYIRSNIPATPAYGVYISQLIWYSRACGSYQEFIDWGLLLTRKQLNQERVPLGSVEVITSKVLRSPPWFGWPVWNMCHKWPRICSTCRNHFSILSSFMTYHLACN